MKKFEEIYEGQVLYTAKEEEFWDEAVHDQTEADGTLTVHTKIKVKDIDGDEVYFKVLDGHFKGKVMMWGWYGSGEAKPEDLLTQTEYDLFFGNIIVDQDNYESTIVEIENTLTGITKEKFKHLLKFINYQGSL